MRVPVKKGACTSNKQGRILLTNPAGQSFNVHVATAYIWEQSDGRNEIKDIVNMLTTELELPKGDPEEENNVVLTLRNLEKKGLIEYTENNRG